MSIPKKLVKGYGSIMPGVFIDEYVRPGIVLGIADNGNHYPEQGIREGDILLFDTNIDYEEGKLSCFVDVFTDKVTMLTSKKDGYEYIGKLVATVRRFD